MLKIRQILTSLLSVYLLVLIVLPCSEAHAKHSVEIQANITQQDSDHHDGIEICTPFCICTSCVIAVVMHPPLEFNFFVPEIPSNHITDFYKSVKSDFHGSIWQPPQLA